MSNRQHRGDDRGTSGADTGAAPPDVLAFWSSGISHELRNQQMVLTHVAFALEQATAAPEPHRDGESVRLGLAGLERGLAILEAFTGLAFPGRCPTPPTVERCFRWVDTLVGPRVSQCEATLVADPGDAGDTTVDPGAASEALASLLAPVVASVRARRTLTLSASPRDGGVEAALRLTAAGVDPDVLLAELTASPGAATRLEEGRLTVRIRSAPDGSR